MTRSGPRPWTLPAVALLLWAATSSPDLHAEEPGAQARYEARLIAHFRDVGVGYEALQEADLADGDERWALALQQRVLEGRRLRRSRPAKLDMASERSQALAAWKLAQHDTAMEVSRLRKVDPKKEGAITLRTRARALLLGYRNACRTARAALTTPQLEKDAAKLPPTLVGRGLSKHELEAPFTRPRAHDVLKQAAGIVRAQHAIEAPEDAQRIEALKGGDLLVVAGQFDRIGRVLDFLRIPYRRVDRYDLPKVPLDGYAVVLWGAGEDLIPAVRRRVLKALRGHVARGGYLLTTDWGIHNVLGELVPGVLTTSGPRSPMREMVLAATPAKAAETHPLLRGVFTPGVQAKWWIEQAAFEIGIGKRETKGLVVLAECTQLETVTKRSPIAAVTFPFKRGRVLHVLPQADQHSGNLEGTIALQRLILNFLAEAVRTDR